MSVLAQRLVYGTLLLGGTLALLWVDHVTSTVYGFLVLCSLLAGTGWLEFGRICDLSRGTRLFGLALVGATIVGTWILSDGPSGARFALLSAVVLVTPLVLLTSSLRSPPHREAFTRIALASLGIVYLLVPVMLFFELRLRAEGELWALLVILLVKGNDIGAYLVGRKFGRRKLIAVSPKKTVEGTAGGFGLGVGIALSFAFLPSPLFSVPEALLVGCAGGLAGQVGDLAESYLKRSFGVKDSGALVPTFGGALDMLDSLLFGAPVVYWLASWIGN